MVNKENYQFSDIVYNLLISNEIPTSINTEQMKEDFIILENKIFAAESGGMPQLDPEFWISQIFWLVLTFGFLYIVLSKYFKRCSF